MGASQSQKSGGAQNKKGGAWTKTLYFDPEADKHKKITTSFPGDKILDKMCGLTASFLERQITRVQVYTESHTTWKDRVPFLKHDDTGHIFLVVTVGSDTYLSLELDYQGIKIQKSRRIYGLTKYCLHRSRKNVDGPKQDLKDLATAITFRKLLEWLQSMNAELRQSDCHDFASRAIKFVTQTTLKITKPAAVCRYEKHMVQFCPETDPDIVSPKYIITHDNLMTMLANKDVIDAEKKIDNVTAYKTPLSENQLFFGWKYHLFIVFQTGSWWWSIEKNDEGLTIQRSKDLEDVKDYYRQNPRLKNNGWLWSWEVTEMLPDESSKTIKELITWLKDEQQLFDEYHWLASNCHDFGKAVFNFIALKKKLSIWI